MSLIPNRTHPVHDWTDPGSSKSGVMVVSEAYLWLSGLEILFMYIVLINHHYLVLTRPYKFCWFILLLASELLTRDVTKFVVSCWRQPTYFYVVCDVTGSLHFFLGFYFICQPPFSDSGA